MNNDIVFWIVISVNIGLLCFLVFYIIYFITQFKKLKKELNKSINRLYNDIEIGEFYTFNDETKIVISNKYQHNNKLYFEYKKVNDDTKLIKDDANDEHYTITVLEFIKLVKHYWYK